MSKHRWTPKPDANGLCPLCGLEMFYDPGDLVWRHAGTVADAVEKPWKWHGDLDLALAVQEHMAEHSTGPWHECQPSSREPGVWRCAPEWVDGVEQFCPWIFRAPEDYELYV